MLLLSVPSLARAMVVSTPLMSTTPASATPWADIAPDAQRLTDASSAKTVLSVCSGGSLCTRLAVDSVAGVGFPSHVGYVTDDEGCPLILLGDSQAATNVREAAATALDGKAPASFVAHNEASVALLGHLESYDPSDLSEFQLSQAAERAGIPADELQGAAWHRLVPERVHYADPRLGLEAWVAAQDCASAAPNPLAGVRADLLSKLATRQPDLDRLAAALAGVPPAEVARSEVITVDQLGFDLRVETTQGAAELRRVGFKLPPQNLEEALSLFVKLFQEAYERQHGWLE